MLPATRHRCHACGALIELSGAPGRRDECERCGAELHVCLNCAHHDATLTRGCRENQAEPVRDVARSNFCGWFTFRLASDDDAAPRPDPAEEARRAFDALFRK